jgi:hypothetical protein
MWNFISVHLETLLVSVQDSCTFVPNVPQAQKMFWTHPIERLGDVGHVESHFSPFGDVLVSMQDRCIVYANHTIGSEIILDAPDGTPR